MTYYSITQYSWNLAQSTAVLKSANFQNDGTTAMDVMDTQDFTRQKLKKGFTVILYYHNEVSLAKLCIQIHGCVKQTNIISR